MVLQDQGPNITALNQTHKLFLNAAINLKQYNTVRYTGINAGGDDKIHVEKSTGGRLRNQNQTNL